MKSLLPTFSTGNIRPTSYLRTPTWNVRPKEIVTVVPAKVETPKPVFRPPIKIGPVVSVVPVLPFK